MNYQSRLTTIFLQVTPGETTLDSVHAAVGLPVLSFEELGNDIQGFVEGRLDPTTRAWYNLYIANRYNDTPAAEEIKKDNGFTDQDVVGFFGQNKMYQVVAAVADALAAFGVDKIQNDQDLDKAFVLLERMCIEQNIATPGDLERAVIEARHWIEEQDRQDVEALGEALGEDTLANLGLDVADKPLGQVYQFRPRSPK